MNIARFLPLVLAAATAWPVTSFAAGSIKAAYVEPVIPGRTWFGNVSVLNANRTTGPGTGVLGISSITLTNFDNTAQQVFVFVPRFAVPSAACSGTVSGGADLNFQVYVPAFSTLHLSYPTPLVVNPVDGFTCIGAQVTTLLHGGSVQINFNGVVN